MRNKKLVKETELRSLSALERRLSITQLAGEQGSVRVRELSELFQVSEVTIRSDLELLTQQGFLLRDRGGAILNENGGLFVAYAQRAAVNLEVKRRIGRFAATLVNPGATIIMDSGTTVMEMAKCLSNDLSLTVITNALNVAIHIGSLPNARVIVLGGSLIRETISTLGHNVERDLNELVVQITFLGANAMDAEFGVTETSAELARGKRLMVHAARRVILLADSYKWGRVSFAKVLSLSDIDLLVSDTGLPMEAQAAIRNLGIELICV